MKQSILAIEALKKYYGKAENQTKALNGISFRVMQGEFLGIRQKLLAVPEKGSRCIFASRC